MRSSQILTIIAAFAIAGQAAGIGQISAWDIVKKHERMARDKNAQNVGIAKASPYGAPYRGNDWEFGEGMEFWDATSLVNVEEYTHEWFYDYEDGMGMRWVPVYQIFVISRNENGLATQIGNFNPDSVSWTNFYYNSNGLCTLSVLQDKLDSTWINHKKTLVEYNGNGQPFSVAQCFWDQNSESWREEWPMLLDLLFYSNSGLLDSAFFKYHSGSGHLSYDTTRYTYGIDGKLLGSIQVRSSGDSILESVTYPSDTIQVNTRKILLDSGTPWQNYDSTVTRYDSKGRQIYFSQFHWDRDTFHYDNYECLEMEYDSSGRILSFLNKMDNGLGGWIDEERGTYKYSSGAKLKHYPTAAAQPSSYRISPHGPVIALQTSKSIESEISFMDAQGKNLETCLMHGTLKWTAPASGIYLISAKTNGRIENFQVAVTK